MNTSFTLFVARATHSMPIIGGQSLSTVVLRCISIAGLWLFIGSTNAVPALHMDSIDDYNTFGAMITPAAYSMGARRLLTSHDPVLQ